MNQNIIFVQTTAAKLAMTVGGQAVRDCISAAREFADTRTKQITALNREFVKSMHAYNKAKPDVNTRVMLSALALAVACDTTKTSHPQIDDDELLDALGGGNWFVGIKLVYKPNNVVTAYASLEAFDDLDEKLAEVSKRPLIQNVDPRAN